MTATPREPVVVVTGASSGIGRATALRFAGRGAHVVLAARREDALVEVASECEQRGGRAVVVPLDVTDDGAAERLAAAAVEAFDRIDVWVNSAAVTAFGRLDETPAAAIRRVLETNATGTALCTQAAVRRFRAQGRGVLVNLSSVVVDLPQPYTAAYNMSKHAIRALGSAVRQELLLDELHDVHVITVLAATIDTPLFQQAANYTGRSVRPMPPVHPAEDVAAAIEMAVDVPEAEIYVGAPGRLIELSAVLAPRRTERRMAHAVEDEHLAPHDPAPLTDGNLFAPAEGPGRISGGWRERQQASAASMLKRLAGGAAALSALATVGALFARTRQA